MLFEPYADIRELPALLAQTAEIGTSRAWRDRFDRCEADARRNPMITPYLDDWFGLERAMGRSQIYLNQTGRFPMRSAGLLELRLFSFAAMLVRVHAQLSSTAKRRMEGRVRSGLDGDNTLAGLAFELQSAANLMHRGVDIHWHDIESNGGFDFLARKDAIEVEIECKTFSADLGRKIHRRRHHQFIELIQPALMKVEQPIFVDVVLATRLHGSEVPALAHATTRALQTLKDIEGPDPYSIVLTQFDQADSPFSDLSTITEDKIKEFVAQRFGSVNDNVVALMNAKGGVGLVAIRCQQPDEVVMGMHRQLKAAAAQLSGKRPGFVRAQMMDISAEEFRELFAAHEQPGNSIGLTALLMRFFAGEQRRHVHTLSFSTHGEMVSHSAGINERGPAHYWVNRMHPACDDASMKIFA